MKHTPHKLLLAGFTTAILLATPFATAMSETQLNQWINAIEQQNYSAAVKIVQPLAEQGDAKAQFYLGLMYDEGSGVPKDERQAFSWYQKAANKGVADAQLNLGISYRDGHGVTQNLKQAHFWLQKAAKQGNAEAQNQLGLMYASGKGVPQNFKQARFWLQKAANQTTDTESREAAQSALQLLNQAGK